jgi:uncharacterized protein YjbI with pentapeptide repeats
MSRRRPFNDPRKANLPAAIMQSNAGITSGNWNRRFHVAIESQEKLDRWLDEGLKLRQAVNGNIDLTKAIAYYLDKQTDKIAMKDLVFRSCSIGDLSVYDAPYLKNVKFERCNFEGMVLQDPVFDYVDFTDCSGSMHFKNLRGNQINIKDCDFQDLNLSDTTIKGMSVAKTKFNEMTSFNNNLNQIDFSECSFNKQYFEGGLLNYVSFEGCKYDHSFTAKSLKWSHAQRTDCTFEFTTLLQVKLAGECSFENEKCLATTNWVGVTTDDDTEIELVDGNFFHFEVTDCKIDRVAFDRCAGSEFAILRSKLEHPAWIENSWAAYFKVEGSELHDSWFDDFKTPSLRIHTTEQYQTQMCKMRVDELTMTHGKSVDPFWYQGMKSNSIVFDKVELFGGQYQEVNTDAWHFLECVARQDINIIDRCVIKELEVVGGDWSRAYLTLNDSLDATEKLRFVAGGWVAALPRISVQLDPAKVAARDWKIEKLNKVQLNRLEAQMALIPNEKDRWNKMLGTTDTSSFGGSPYSYGNEPPTRLSVGTTYKLGTDSNQYKGDKFVKRFFDMIEIDKASVKEHNRFIRLMIEHGCCPPPEE